MALCAVDYGCVATREYVMDKSSWRALGASVLLLASGCASSLPARGADGDNVSAKWRSACRRAVEQFHFWGHGPPGNPGAFRALGVDHPERGVISSRCARHARGSMSPTSWVVTSTGRRVSRNFDFVTFELPRCRIAEIRRSTSRA